MAAGLGARGPLAGAAPPRGLGAAPPLSVASRRASLGDISHGVCVSARAGPAGGMRGRETPSDVGGLADEAGGLSLGRRRERQRSGGFSSSDVPFGAVSASVGSAGGAGVGGVDGVRAGVENLKAFLSARPATLPAAASPPVLSSPAELGWGRGWHPRRHRRRAPYAPPTELVLVDPSRAGVESSSVSGAAMGGVGTAGRVVGGIPEGSCHPGVSPSVRALLLRGTRAERLEAARFLVEDALETLHETLDTPEKRTGAAVALAVLLWAALLPLKRLLFGRRGRETRRGRWVRDRSLGGKMVFVEEDGQELPDAKGRGSLTKNPRGGARGQGLKSAVAMDSSEGKGTGADVRDGSGTGGESEGGDASDSNVAVSPPPSSPTLSAAPPPPPNPLPPSLPVWYLLPSPSALVSASRRSAIAGQAQQLFRRLEAAAGDAKEYAIGDLAVLAALGEEAGAGAWPDLAELSVSLASTSTESLRASRARLGAGPSTIGGAEAMFRAGLQTALDAAQEEEEEDEEDEDEEEAGLETSLSGPPRPSPSVLSGASPQTLLLGATPVEFACSLAGTLGVPPPRAVALVERAAGGALRARLVDALAAAKEGQTERVDADLRKLAAALRAYPLPPESPVATLVCESIRDAVAANDRNHLERIVETLARIDRALARRLKPHLL